MPSEREIAESLKRLRGEIPSGRMFEPDGTPQTEEPRPYNWRHAQSRTPITDILRGR